MFKKIWIFLLALMACLTIILAGWKAHQEIWGEANYYCTLAVFLTVSKINLEKYDE